MFNAFTSYDSVMLACDDVDSKYMFVTEAITNSIEIALTLLDEEVSCMYSIY